MSLKRLPQLVYNIDTSYIVIIVINKDRYFELFDWVISKD